MRRCRSIQICHPQLGPKPSTSIALPAPRRAHAAAARRQLGVRHLVDLDRDADRIVAADFFVTAKRASTKRAAAGHLERRRSSPRRPASSPCAKARTGSGGSATEPGVGADHRSAAQDVGVDHGERPGAETAPGCGCCGQHNEQRHDRMNGIDQSRICTSEPERFEQPGNVFEEHVTVEERLTRSASQPGVREMSTISAPTTTTVLTVAMTTDRRRRARWSRSAGSVESDIEECGFRIRVGSLSTVITGAPVK